MKAFLTNRLNASVQYLSSVLRWTRKSTLIWYLCLPLLVNIFIVLMRPDEFGIRSAGLIFQLIGIIEVLLGIRNTRMLFSKPRFLKSIKDLILDFPIPGRTRQVVLVGRASSKSEARSIAAFKSKKPEDGSVESRMDAFEANLHYLREDLTQTIFRFDEHLREIRRILGDEEKSRTEEDQKILEKLERSSTEGLDVSLIGSVYIFFGVILSTFPENLARLIQ